MRRMGFTLSVILVILMAFTLQSTFGETYNWRLQSVWRTPATQDGLKLFAENVKKETKGKINIKVYAANELVKIRGTFGAVQSGAVEMACSAGPYNARVVPEGNVEFGLPFSWRNWGEAWEAWTKYGLQEKIREAYAEKGVHLITIQPAAEYCLMSTKPVRKVEDLKGMKIRVVGLTAKTYQALGAAPTTIPGAEQYVALQRGTVDGTIYPVFVLDAYKLKEVIKYVILPSIISPPTTEIYMNLDLWKGLSQELKDAVMRASTQHQAYMDKRYLEEGWKAVGSFVMKGIGETIVLPDSEVKKIRKAAFAEWDKLGAKSPRLKELVKSMKKFMADKGISAD
jgi:TRAP-type C4-dicarboxylate transport system substrate-binding protein